MGIDDSGGVTALVGLDGFVVCAQVHDGEQWWLARRVALGRSVMAGVWSRSGTWRSPGSR